MPREPSLDRLTTLLGQCLGRIDERAWQLQQLGDDDDYEVECVLAQETTTLQDLVGSLIDDCAGGEGADLNRIVVQAVSACVRQLGTPIVVRQRLAPQLPAIACSPSHLVFATQRALVIAAGRLQPGGELTVTTRHEAGSVMLEIEARGGRRDRHLHQRSQTLCEFVSSFRGNCCLDVDDRDNLLLVIELPEALAIDDR